MPRNRIGRWVVIGTLPDGRTITGQNRPTFSGTHTLEEMRQRETQRLRSARFSLMARDIEAEDREVRETYGVPVR